MTIEVWGTGRPDFQGRQQLVDRVDEITVTAAARVSGQPVRVEGKYYPTGDYYPLSVTQSGELEVNIKPGDIIAVISGEVISKISGETVIISGQPVSISGQPVDLVAETISVLSGQLAVTSGEIAISGSVTVISGVMDVVPAEEIKTGPIRIPTTNSGGEVLHSGSVKSLTVKALTNNSGDIYLGGINSKPYSGYGFCLAPGEAKSYDVSDFNKVYIMATISGDKITFDGIL